MARIYANRIWAGDYNYNSTAKAYVKLKDKVTKIMCEDVSDKKHTEEEFEKITGLVYKEVVVNQ